MKFFDWFAWTRYAAVPPRHVAGFPKPHMRKRGGKWMASTWDERGEQVLAWGPTAGQAHINLAVLVVLRFAEFDRQAPGWCYLPPLVWE